MKILDWPCGTTLQSAPIVSVSSATCLDVDLGFSGKRALGTTVNDGVELCCRFRGTLTAISRCCRSIVLRADLFVCAPQSGSYFRASLIEDGHSCGRGVLCRLALSRLRTDLALAALPLKDGCLIAIYLLASYHLQRFKCASRDFDESEGSLAVHSRL